MSYLTAEPLNSLLMSKLKIKWQGLYIALGFVGSTVIAAALDSFLFRYPLRTSK